jgi:predicted transcriptional regulator
MPEDLQDDRVRNEVETRKTSAHLLDVASERFLLLLQLLEKVFEQLLEAFVAVPDGDDVFHVARVLNKPHL